MSELYTALLAAKLAGGGDINEQLVAGANIVIEETSDGKAKISASGEVSSEDTYAREEIQRILDGTTLDSFGDVETALEGKADTTDIPTVPITAIQKNGTDITPVSGTVNITVPTQASDINAATATQGGKADTAIQGIKVNSSTVNPDSNKVVNITVPTSAADVSALPASTKYAGAASAGGSATSAAKLDTSSAGSVTQPVYFANGVPTATTYSLEKSVPSNAVFTDTTYTFEGTYNASTNKAATMADIKDGKLTGYAQSSGNVAATDKVIEAIGKVEKKADDNKNNISLNKTDIYNNFAIGKNKLTYTLTTLQTLNTDGTWNNNEWTKNGVTFTLNPDNTITATGTLPAATNVIMNVQNYTGASGDILTAEQYGADHYIYLRGGSTAVNNAIYKAFDNSDIGVSREVAIAIIGESSSKTVNYLFKPMVCSESAYLASPTYFPHAMSNVELTVAIQALQAQLANQ